MKKLLIAACLSSVSLLSACTPDVSEIQRITTQVCGFVPTAVQVASLFPNPYTVPAGMIAQAICAAVTQQVPMSTRHALKRRGAAGQTTVTVTVNGQVLNVSGYFVR